MKFRALFLIFLILVAAFLTWKFWPSKPAVPSPDKSRIASVNDSGQKSSEATAPKAVELQDAVLPTKPRLFKSTHFPPQTTEEKLMWDWWRDMEKADPKFEWKTPIEFYGKVVDQKNEPVQGALVVLTWTVVGGSKERRLTTDSDGKFTLTNEKGKRMTVNILKNGYLATPESFQSFEFSAFFENLFFVPDKEHPVIFRLRSLDGAEPMNKYYATTRIPPAQPIFLDVRTGTFGAIGDIQLTVNIPGKDALGNSGISVDMHATPGAGFVFSEEPSLYEAPNGNYLDQATRTNTAQKRRLLERFYVKSRSGEYASVEMNVILWERLSEVSLDATIFHNPSGSRNLLFDDTKRLNPR